MQNSENNQVEFSLTSADIYRAVDEGVFARADADKLVDWGFRQSFRTASAAAKSILPEQRKGLNLVTVAYYFGAMLMISACAWFLGDKWERLGSAGILATSLVYLTIAAGVGIWLRRKDYLVGGGLLITVAVCLVPLVTYCVEDLSGWWVIDKPGAYQDFYPLINASWIVMELATIAAAAVALYFVRFGFLTAPLAFLCWFFSMDVAALIYRTGELEWNKRMWVSVIVGLITLFIGFVLDKTLIRRGQSKSEDFAFWCYFFGMLAFWGGLTGIDSNSEIGRAVYALINIGLIGAAIVSRRTTFLVFGALGVHIYLGHLAYTVFKDSFFFPFALALLGLSMIFLTVWAQRWMTRSKINFAR